MSPTSDYLSFITSLPNFTPMSVMTLFFLGIMRLAPIVAMVPFLGSKLPATVKMGLAISLTLIMLPHIIMTSHEAVEFDMHYLFYSLKELLIGFILAFFAGMPFYIAQGAGVLVDFLRGSSSLQVTDPLMQTQVSPVGLLYNYVLIVLFFDLGGPFYFFEGVMNSYDVIPADAVISGHFFNIHQPFWQACTEILTRFTAISIQLSAPSLVAILMAEMFLGIANRLAPQVQIAFLGMAIKSLLGLGLLYAGWFFILQQMGKQTLLWFSELMKLLPAMRS